MSLLSAQRLPVGLLVAILLGSLCGTALCRPDFEERYRAARDLYEAHDYSGSAAAFLDAYGVRADPRLLLNAGNAWLMAGKPAEALRMYDRAAGHRPPLDDASQAALRDARALAEERLRKAEPAAVQVARPEPAEARTAGPEPAAVQAARPEPAAVQAAIQAPSPARPAWRSPWLWGTLSAVVVAGVVTGAVLATRPGDPLTDVPDANRFSLPF